MKYNIEIFIGFQDKRAQWEPTVTKTPINNLFILICMCFTMNSSGKFLSFNRFTVAYISKI